MPLIVVVGFATLLLPLAEARAQVLQGYFDKDMIQSRVDLMVFKGLLDELCPLLGAHFGSFGFDISCVTVKWWPFLAPHFIGTSSLLLSCCKAEYPAF